MEKLIFLGWLAALAVNALPPVPANSVPNTYNMQNKVQYAKYEQCTKLCLIEDFTCLDKCLTKL